VRADRTGTSFSMRRSLPRVPLIAEDLTEPVLAGGVARARGVGTLDRERDLFWGGWSVHAL